VTHKFKGNAIKVKDCPAKEMVADFYTKSLQGSLLVIHRNSMLGIDPNNMPLFMKEYVNNINKSVFVCIL